MTRKDYEAIAQAIKNSTSRIKRDDYKMMFQDLFINDLCNILKADNPRFQADKFREACK